MTKLKGKVKINYPKDLLGERFGRLTVVGNPFKDERGRNIQYQCICDCGEKKTIVRSRLTRGETKSCGCFRKQATTERVVKYGEHGAKNTRIYSIWNSMIGRCYSKKHSSYERYGGRGIAVCQQWKNDFLAFKNWAENNGYDESLSIDRINVNGNYEPSNCKWSDNEEQSQNRRNTIIVTIQGVEYKSLSLVARTFNISRHVLQYRYDAGVRGDDLIKEGGTRVKKYWREGMKPLEER